MEPTDRYLAKVAQRAYDQSTHRWKGVEALLVEEHDFDVLAFRGTEGSIRDVIRDLRAIPWHDTRLGWCHAGFLKAGRGIWPQIEWLVESRKPLFLTGHSKGAAEATIVAGLFTAAGKAPAALVTFGSPKCGFWKLRDVLWNVPVRRYVHGRDHVTKVPRFYPHVREPIPLGEPGNPLADHILTEYLVVL